MPMMKLELGEIMIQDVCIPPVVFKYLMFKRK